MTTVWIFNHYAEPPDRQATRSFELGRELVRAGHAVTIFSSSFSHYRFREEKLLPGEPWKLETIDGVRFIWLRTFPYAANDWRRLVNMLSYLISARRVARRMADPPEVVIGVTVHPFAALAGYLVARARDARFILEITDLWPRTLVEFGLLPSRHPAVWVLGWLERFLFVRADRVISLLPHIDLYLRERGLDPGKVVWIPNGVDLSRYASLQAYDGTAHRPFTVMYVGGLVQANALDVVLDAARILQDRGDAGVRFVFVGGGQDESRLTARAAALGLRNVTFQGLVAKERLPDVMAGADAFVFSLRALPLYRYGISLNKMCDYLAAGRPVLFAGASSYDPIAAAGAGTTVPPEDPRALADAIVALRDLPAEARAQMARNGVAYVRAHHDIARLAKRLEALLAEVGRHASGSAAMTSARDEAIKRLFDIVVSAAGLLILAPIAALIAGLIVLDSPGPVLYRSVRVGRFGRPFVMLKFRTMVERAEQLGGPSTADDDPRITRVGRWLRKLKLDEIPQLLNVLRGEMSIVGPRPEVPQYAALLRDEERAILSVRPGMTDWATVWNIDEGAALAGQPDVERAYLENIRPHKVRLQLEYVRTRSLWTDLRIIARTFAKMLANVAYHPRRTRRTAR